MILQRHPATGACQSRRRRTNVHATAAPTAQIRIGTRGSTLAKLQSVQVQGLLRKVRPEWTDQYFELVEFVTHGDKERTEQLRALGQGAFTEAIDQAVASGQVDIGVHSLKDQPVRLPEGVELAACLPRDDPRDAFISLKAHTLGVWQHRSCLTQPASSPDSKRVRSAVAPSGFAADLPTGARVGTSSLRRKAQLLHAHPHLQVVAVRGNIDSRLKQLETGELDAIVLAAAGLSRLGQSQLATRVLDFEEMLPAVCQGAIGVTCRSEDPFLRWELGLICHEPTRLEIAAERAMLAALLAPSDAAATSSTDEAGKASSSKSSTSTGAAVPGAAAAVTGISSITGLPLLPSFAIACHAGFDPHAGVVKVDGLVASEDGRTLHRLHVSGGAGAPEDAEEIGRQLGEKLREFVLQHGWL